MSTRQTTTNTPTILPHPGYLLTMPYTPKDETFKGVRQEAGQDQKSIVIAVGDPVEDSNGILRTPGVGKGDVIIHAASNKDFELDFTLYRFVHFTEVHGVLEEDNAAK